MNMLKRYQCTCQFDFSGYNCQRSKCIQWARLGPAWLGWAGLGWACQLSFRLAGFGVSCLEMGLIRFKFSLRSASTQLQLSQSWRGSFFKITVLLHYSMFGKLDCCLSVLWVHIQIQLNFPRSIVTQFQKLRTKIKLCRSNILYVSYLVQMYIILNVPLLSFQDVQGKWILYLFLIYLGLSLRNIN